MKSLKILDHFTLVGMFYMLLNTYNNINVLCHTISDRSGLESPDKIENMQEPILEALKHYVRSRRKDQPQTYAKMLMKITDLRSISVKGT